MRVIPYTMITTAVEDIKKMRGSGVIEFKCDVCNSTFFRTKRQSRETLSELLGNNYKNKRKSHVCGQKCFSVILKTPVSECVNKCGNCGKEVLRVPRRVKLNKSGLVFCDSSCAATHSNAHKTKGYRVSKLEVWLAAKLVNLYPYLEFHFNRKDAIESELDIYIPSLKLAFELNGIFHYEPIYGDGQLQKIKNNDGRKFSACAERGISLCVIDTSKQKYFKDSTSIQYLDIIVKIINEKIGD